MFAYINTTNDIMFISPVSVERPDLTELEYDSDTILDPVYHEWKIIQRTSVWDIRASKLRELITAEDYTTVDITGIALTDTEKGDIIMARLFKDEVTGMPNPHAQMALTVKATQAQMRMMAWQQKPGDAELLQYAWEKEEAINALRAFFKYSDTL